MIVNFMILIGPFILSIMYPNVGKLAGLMGAFGGLFTIYILPTITYLSQSEMSIENPELIIAQRNNEFSTSPRKHTPSFDINESSGSDDGF